MTALSLVPVPSIRRAVSTVSVTGVSSGVVTRRTWQRDGSVSIATTSSACWRTGPPPAASATP